MINMAIVVLSSGLKQRKHNAHNRCPISRALSKTSGQEGRTVTPQPLETKQCCLMHEHEHYPHYNKTTNSINKTTLR